MRPWLKWLLLVALLAYAAGMSAWAYAELQARRCTGIDVFVEPVEGTSAAFLHPEAVKGELGAIARDYASRPVGSIDTEALERRLCAISNFESAEVLITAQGRLQVRVVPMIPELRVFTPHGTYYINKDGKRLDARADYYADLPVAVGDFSRRMPATGVLPVVRFIQRDTLLRNLITMVDYRSPRSILLVPRIRGHIVELGDTSALADKFARLKLFYRKVLPHQGWEKYDTVSVKYRGQIVATRADKSVRVHGAQGEEEYVDPEETDMPFQPLDSI